MPRLPLCAMVAGLVGSPAACAPVLALLRRNPAFRTHGVRGIALVVWASGVYWFARRAFGL